MDPRAQERPVGRAWEGWCLVPDDADPECEGAHAHDAFQVARAYLAAPKNSAACDLLLAAAVAAHRDTVSRQQAPETATDRA